MLARRAKALGPRSTMGPPTPARSMSAKARSFGILIRSPSRQGVAEEAPGTSKDVSAVFDAGEAAGLAKKAARLEPLVCIKGWTPLCGRIGRAVSFVHKIRSTLAGKGQQ